MLHIKAKSMAVFPEGVLHVGPKLTAVMEECPEQCSHAWIVLTSQLKSPKMTKGLRLASKVSNMEVSNSKVSLRCCGA
jgi:hypothetical protein